MLPTCYNATMKIVVPPGLYVVAVSGGVDSMVLLDLLLTVPELYLVVAHLDHGIRKDSRQDRILVETTARMHNLPFEYREARLSRSVSEADARKVRYDFLDAVRQQYGAQAIITAHHQDDVIETAFLNLLRGTGRKGLSSLRSSDKILRPLLQASKQDIREYAKENAIRWREDSTNQDERYLRNFVRLSLIPQLTPVQRQRLSERLMSVAIINQELDALLLDNLHAHMALEGLNRQWFIMLPYDISAEVIASWLRQTGIRDFDRKTIERLVIAAKTALPGKHIDVIAGSKLHIGRQYLAIVSS